MSAVLVAEPEVETTVEPLFERLRLNGIRIPRPAEALDYLKQFPDIIPVVNHACELTVAEFAGKATLSLEVYVDPEIDDDHLMLYVQMGGYDAANNDAIEGIFEVYAEGMIHCAGWMMVMQDFR